MIVTKPKLALSTVPSGETGQAHPAAFAGLRSERDRELSDSCGQREPEGAADVVETHDIVRPPAELSAALAAIGSATASAELSRMGIRSAFIRGPVSVTPGVCVAGPAL